MDHNLQSKQIILKLVKDALTTAMRQDRRSTADHAASVAGHKEWDKHNPEDGVGGMSQNPYYPVNAKEVMENARKHHKVMQEAYDYAVKTFIVGEAE